MLLLEVLFGGVTGKPSVGKLDLCLWSDYWYSLALSPIMIFDWSLLLIIFELFLSSIDERLKFFCYYKGSVII